MVTLHHIFSHGRHQRARRARGRQAPHRHALRRRIGGAGGRTAKQGESRRFLTEGVVRFERGTLVNWVPRPRLDTPCAFGFRAAPELWRRYLQAEPEPIFHDVFAMMMRVPEFVLEGDTLVAMQHARALHRVMRLMRHVTVDGMPGGTAAGAGA